MGSKQAQFLDALRKPIAWVGMVLICIGVISFGYVGLALIDVLKDPQNAQLVRWVNTVFSADDVVLNISSSQGKEITIKASDTLQIIFYGLIAVIILNGVIAVSRGLISGGVQLLQLTHQEYPVDVQTDKDEHYRHKDQKRL